MATPAPDARSRPAGSGGRGRRRPAFLGALLFVATAASGTPAWAQDAWLLGEWCAANGERMIVERSGPGFNEHTVCTWLGRRPAGTTVNTRVACANIYGEGARTDEQTLRFRAVRTGPQSVSVRLGRSGAMAYRKC